MIRPSFINLVSSTAITFEPSQVQFVRIPEPLPKSERPTFHFAVSYAALTSVSSALAIAPPEPVSLTAFVEIAIFTYISLALVSNLSNLTPPAAGVASPSAPKPKPPESPTGAVATILLDLSGTFLIFPSNGEGSVVRPFLHTGK